MFVLIVGGGKTGYHLATLLLNEDHHILVVESRQAVVERLKGELPAGAVMVGDGSDPAVLEAAGVARADVLAAVTGEDETNLVTATLARFEFAVPRVIARVNNPRNAWLFTPEMGVDVALNQTDLMAKVIQEKLVMGDLMTVRKLRRGNVALVQEQVLPGSALAGKFLHELSLPPNCTLTAVMRGGEVIVPRGETRLQAGDEILAVVHVSQLAHLAALFKAG